MLIHPYKNKCLLAILGVPHSGTTLVNNIINSATNAFSISEPFWSLLCKIPTISCDKVDNLIFDKPQNILLQIRKRLLQDDKYICGGIKETYRYKCKKMLPFYENIIKASDIIIFVFREPLSAFNALKKYQNKHASAQEFICNYLKLYDIAFNLYKSKRGAICVLEKIHQKYLQHPNYTTQYFNDISNKLFTINGDFILNKAKFTLGSYKAHRSNIILPSNFDKSLLNINEIKQIKDSLYNKYDDLLAHY